MKEECRSWIKIFRKDQCYNNFKCLQIYIIYIYIYDEEKAITMSTCMDSVLFENMESINWEFIHFRLYIVYILQTSFVCPCGATIYEDPRLRYLSCVYNARRLKGRQTLEHFTKVQIRNHSINNSCLICIFVKHSSVNMTLVSCSSPFPSFQFLPLVSFS